MEAWRNLFDLKFRKESVERTVKSTISALQDFYKERDWENLVSSVTEGDGESILLQIKTPTSDGRLRLEWSVSEAMEPVAILVAERPEHNEGGKVFWKRVLDVCIPRSGEIKMASGGEAIDAKLGDIVPRDGSRDFYYAIAFQIAYRIAGGK